jgi:hypothetical protein
MRKSLKGKTNIAAGGYLEKMMQDSSLAIMDSEELKKIIGGDPTPAQVSALLASLNNIFVNNTAASGNPNATLIWNDFQTQIGLLATTNVGFAMLTDIVANANGKHISITGANAPSGALAKYYDAPNGGSIALGGLDFDPSRNPSSYNYTDQDADHYGTIAHELFHAYTFFVQGNTAYTNTVRNELDAYIFEFMATAEVDQKNNTADWNQSYTRWDDNLYTGGRASNENRFQFNNAWYDIFHNHNFTVSNYNTLIEYFKSTTQGSHEYYANLTANAIDSTTFNSSHIFDFYSSDYRQASYCDTIPTVLTANAPRHPVGAVDIFGFSWDTWYALEDSMNSGGSSGATNSGGSGGSQGGGDPFDYGFDFWWALVGLNGYFNGINQQDWYNDLEGQYNSNPNGNFWQDIHYNGYGTPGSSYSN